MSNPVCMTVDVEDFYDGMAALGHDVARPPGPAPGLAALLDRLQSQPKKPKVTLFVVGNYAASVRHDLAAFAAAGHEIASHGPDHGRLPGTGVIEWLRTGRQILEDLLGVAVHGFRSPRFDVPGEGGLEAYRNALAEAGYRYVSDTSVLGPRSPVREVPVLAWRGLRLGWGQLPAPAALLGCGRRHPGLELAGRALLPLL